MADVSVGEGRAAPLCDRAHILRGRRHPRSQHATSHSNTRSTTLPPTLWSSFCEPILHWDGTALSPKTTSLTATQLNSVWGSSATDVLVTGQDGGVLRYDGTRWRQVVAPGPVAFLDIAGTGPNDVWVAGGATSVAGSVIHWDGTQWTPILAPPNVTFPPLTSRQLYGTWPGGPGSVWVVGQQSYSASYAGGLWSKHSGDTIPGPPDLRDVWGVSTTDFWAVGDVGAAFNFYHWTGSGYSYIKVSNIGDLKGVWGRAGNDIWAVGLSGTTVHYDGAQWTAIPSFVGTNLWGVGLGTGSDFWAVGDAGTILRWNGATWVRADSGTVANLLSVWGDGQSTAYAVGNGGVMLRYLP